METKHLPRFSLLSWVIFETSTAELMQLYRMHRSQTTRPIMLVVSKVTLVVWVGGATVVVALPNPSIMPNMPGLHSFSVGVKKLYIYILFEVSFSYPDCWPLRTMSDKPCIR